MTDLLRAFLVIRTNLEGCEESRASELDSAFSPITAFYYSSPIGMLQLTVVGRAYSTNCPVGRWCMDVYL